MGVYGFIGLGLIGGSIAKALKKQDPKCRIYAYNRRQSNIAPALAEGVLDMILDSPYSDRLSECDIVFLCAPVETNISYMERISGLLKEGAILTDVGSTKTAVCEYAKKKGLRNFIGGHPMAGSDKTGYSAACDYLFSNAYYIITPVFEDPGMADKLKMVAEAVHAIPVILDPETHDRAVAAVSHLPHVIASVLVNLVSQEDNPEATMRMLAAGGFRDTTRIAASSPEMWDQICATNAGPLSLMLDRFIEELTHVSRKLKGDTKEELSILRMFSDARDYRSTMNMKNIGSLIPDHSFSVDIADEVGAISTISVILASKGISIKNIGINNARDHGEGALRITFYEEEAMVRAYETLKRYQYDLRG